MKYLHNLTYIIYWNISLNLAEIFHKLFMNVKIISRWNIVSAKNIYVILRTYFIEIFHEILQKHYINFSWIVQLYFSYILTRSCIHNFLKYFIRNLAEIFHTYFINDLKGCNYLPVKYCINLSDITYWNISDNLV